jgi:hypothetical protein
MDQPLITRQGVDAAYGKPDNVSRFVAVVEVEGSNSPKRPLSCAYEASKRSPVLLGHLFFGAQLLCPPPLLFCSLFISSCG